MSEKKISNTGIMHIFSTYNNTILHLTDMAGSTIARVSGGRITKHDRLKANPTVAMFAAKEIAEKAKEAKIDSLYVRIKGKQTTGPGAHAAVKSLSKQGLRIINIADVTPMPRGGPKKKGGKRGRRV